jgi:hypothetical protein
VDVPADQSPCVGQLAVNANWPEAGPPDGQPEAAHWSGMSAPYRSATQPGAVSRREGDHSRRDVLGTHLVLRRVRCAFPSWRLWNAAAATGAHLLWRAKASMLLPRIGTFTDGSWLAVLPKPGTGRRRGTWVRVIEYTVTVTTTDPTTGTATTRTELFRLLTTITDPQVASAAELAGCYRERWESERLCCVERWQDRDRLGL